MNYERFNKLIDVYQERYRAKELDRFDLGEPYDLFPDRGPSLFESAITWPNGWPLPSRAGVYVFVDDEGSIQYIGKASFRSSLAARMSTYCRYDSGRGTGCKLNHEWKNEPRYILTAAVPDSSRFEASSLEEFLIERIQPKGNYIGIERIA